MTTSRKLLVSVLTSILLASIIFSGAEPTRSKDMVLAEPTVTISFPANGSSIRASEFTSIRGTFTTPAGCRRMKVKVSLGKNESDEEWACCDTRPGVPAGTYKWVTGPTGQWLTTNNRSSWTAPPGTGGYTLPSGDKLPDGAYVIYAYAEGEAVPQTTDQCKSKQERILFKVAGR
jgi:hypothetical protein